MIAKIIIAAIEARRLIGSAIRLLKYFVQPKPDKDLDLHEEGERLLRAQRLAFLTPGVSSSPASAARWAKVVAVQFFALVKAWRGAAEPPAKYFEHLMIGFHPSDGRRLGATEVQRGAKAEEIIIEALALAGLARHPCAVVIHGDTKHVHGHIMIGTVGHDGRIWNPGKRIYRQLERVMERLEIKHNLHRVNFRIAFANDPSRNPKKSAPTPAEKRKSKKTEAPSARKLLQNIVEDALNSSNDFFEFLDRIEQGPARLVLYRFDKGRLGCAFRLDGVTLSGTSLGRGFTWPKIAEKIQYNPLNPNHKQAVLARVASEKLREKRTSLTILPKEIGSAQEREYSALSKMKSEQKEDHSEYRFRPSGRSVVLRVYTTKIEVGPYSPDAVEAALALARQRGWEEVSMRGQKDALARANLVIAARVEAKNSAARPRL